MGYRGLRISPCISCGDKAGKDTSSLCKVGKLIHISFHRDGHKEAFFDTLIDKFDELVLKISCYSK